MPELVLTLHTRLHTYAILHHQEVELRHVPLAGLAEKTDRRNRPLVDADLGLLLDQADHSDYLRRCALIVELRRRSVALLCDAVSELHEAEPAMIMPLPSLIARRLPHSWIAGVYMPADVPILLLNLRQIALHVVRQTVQGDTS